MEFGPGSDPKKMKAIKTAKLSKTVKYPVAVMTRVNVGNTEDSERDVKSAGLEHADLYFLSKSRFTKSSRGGHPNLISPTAAKMNGAKP